MKTVITAKTMPRRLPVVVHHRYPAPLIASLPGKLLSQAREHPLWFGSGLLVIVGILAVTVTPLWSAWWAEHHFIPKRLVQRYPATITLPAPLPAYGARRPLKRRLVGLASLAFALDPSLGAETRCVRKYMRGSAPTPWSISNCSKMHTKVPLIREALR
jgi:hypothetical protein